MPELKAKPRVRRTNHKISPADLLRRHSPIKNGLKIKDEDKPLHKFI
jgi:hypothetical protein